MASADAKLNIKDVAKDIHVTVSLVGLPVFWLRFAIGCLLIRLGSWIVGFGRVKI